jgi:hypothetical protein
MLGLSGSPALSAPAIVFSFSGEPAEAGFVSMQNGAVWRLVNHTWETTYITLGDESMI